MTTATLDLSELVQGIPGYDPVATAGESHFNANEAARALDFFPACLRHVKGERAGQPLELEPWEAAIIANAFGWLRPDGTRRYRIVFVYVPRKNGKTTLTGGVVCYMLFVDDEPGAELYGGAADAKQARLVWDQVTGMIRQEAELAARCTVYRGYKSIELRDLRATYRVISHAPDTKHGFNTQFFAIDELHAQPDRDLVDVLETSTGSRRQPLGWYITTADWDRPSICNEKLDYARKVRDGVLEDPTFLPVIYEAGRDEDWTNPKLWARVNPNLGVSLSLDYLERECRRAKEIPAYENTFKRLHLNMQTGQSQLWISLDKWDACAGKVDAKVLKGEPCYGGLDLSSTRDVTAFVLFFPKTGHVLPWFWVPADSAEERERRDRVPYRVWERQGLLELTPGNVIDTDIIEERILQVAGDYAVQDIGFDRWNSMAIVQHLMNEGLSLVPFGQGFASMSYPSKELERRVLATTINHGGHPVLRWMMSNCQVVSKRDEADNIKPDKQHSSDRIDGIVALIMAIGRAMANDAGATPGSVYDKRGIAFL